MMWLGYILSRFVVASAQTTHKCVRDATYDRMQGLGLSCSGNVLVDGSTHKCVRGYNSAEACEASCCESKQLCKIWSWSPSTGCWTATDAQQVDWKNSECRPDACGSFRGGSIGASRKQDNRSTLIVSDADLGPLFEGVGGVSGGGGSSRLLFDYEERFRSDILDLLFKPKFGASLHHLKVEIGCEGDTGMGSEQTHARVASDSNFNRGYEIKLMQEAAARNPSILLSGLEWGVPGWIPETEGGMWGIANINYMVDWVNGLKQRKNLTIAALGVAYNERSFNASFIKAIRKALDSAGYTGVRTIAADSYGKKEWDIAKAIGEDADLAAAVDIIGVHCPGVVNGQSPVPSYVRNLGKPMWSTEQHIGEKGLGGNDTYPSLPSWDYSAALGVAKVLNQGYIEANQTSTLIWTAVYSWYDYLVYAGKGLLVANTPWSGHYMVPDTVWAVAHTTQFVQPGWRFGASSLLSDGIGSVVSYVSPNGRDLTIVVESGQSKVINTLVVTFNGAYTQLSHLHQWRTRQGQSFHRLDDVLVQDAKAHLTISPGEILTLTTTTGQRKGSDGLNIPAQTIFKLPHDDDFEAYNEESSPRFLSDMHGAFTVASVDGLGKVLRQQTPLDPVSTHEYGATAFATIMGDSSWLDYIVSVSARGTTAVELNKYEANSSSRMIYLASHVGVMRSSFGKAGVWPHLFHSSVTASGFILQILYDPPRWILRVGVGKKCSESSCPMKTLAEGTGDWIMADWLHIELAAFRTLGTSETTISAMLNGKALTPSMSVATSIEARGGIALGCGLHGSEWDNLSVRSFREDFFQSSFV
eukprot:TRINITY_DN49621_c0_g1_i1.p1 TRINITY_DN49621_c0_g1~~TRINITY_DN49621_c0_g1_i1.p1  ORF type:complete len:812 (-),score=82.98 TRINITY_DN49621_c0_g1_i1:457-2892(-)